MSILENMAEFACDTPCRN